MTYQVVEIATVEQAREEGLQMGHAVEFYFKQHADKGMRFFSMRNSETGHPVLTMSTDANAPDTINHIVGYANQRPRSAQLEHLRPLLAVLNLKIAPEWGPDRYMVHKGGANAPAAPQPVDPATMKLDEDDNVIDPGTVRRGNPQNDEEYEADVIVEAAMSLARMVARSNQPLVLDVSLYMELVSGVVCGAVNPDVWDRVGSPDMSDEEKQGILDTIIAARDMDRSYDEQARKFINDLSDAFTFEEVCEVCPCILAEVGMTDYYPDLGEANVILIFKQPRPEEVLQVIL